MGSSANGDPPLDTDPARPDEVIGEFQRSGPQDVEAGHRRGEGSGEWTPAPLRGEIVARPTRMLFERKPKLAKTITHEAGNVLVDPAHDVRDVHIDEPTD